MLDSDNELVYNGRRERTICSGKCSSEPGKSGKSQAVLRPTLPRFEEDATDVRGSNRRQPKTWLELVHYYTGHPEAMN
jgi:hypothetical protein